MDWALAIDRNRDQLLRIIAALFVVAGLAEGKVVAALPRNIYRAVLLVLRPSRICGPASCHYRGARARVAIAFQALCPLRPHPGQGCRTDPSFSSHRSAQAFCTRRPGNYCGSPRVRSVHTAHQRSRSVRSSLCCLSHSVGRRSHPCGASLPPSHCAEACVGQSAATCAAAGALDGAARLYPSESHPVPARASVAVSPRTATRPSQAGRSRRR